MSSIVPEHTRVVIVGGGIIGCSIAYHLTLQGWSDVTLLEQNQLSSGTTWHAAGVVGSLRASPLLTNLTAIAAGIFKEVEKFTGQDTGYKQTGGFFLAQNEERLEELKRIAAVGRLTGLEPELLTPAEVTRRCEILYSGDLTGALWNPWDGQTNPTDSTMAFAKGARMGGARIIEGVRVERLETQRGAISGVMTNQGAITCEVAVLCAGMWTRHLARAAGVSVPLQAVEHMYLTTEPMSGVALDQPFVRDLDGHIYLKGDAGKLVLGSVDPISKPCYVSTVPSNNPFGLFQEDWDHFEPFLNAGLKRVPTLADAGIRQFLNGPESFTADGQHVVGEAPLVRNLFVAAGFNTTGIMSSPGIGKLVAEWIVGGEAPMDVTDIDVRRFESWQSNDAFMGERIIESPGLAFAMHWPYRQHESARGVKRSPVHDRLAAKGACFGVVAGWERPLWYVPGDSKPTIDYTFGEQHWWQHASREVTAIRHSVALFDLSQFAVFELHGPDALANLQSMCANNVDVPLNRAVYTQLLNTRGGIECDLTVTRTGNDCFRIVTGAPLRTRDLHWIATHLPADTRSVLVDLTSSFAVFAVMGPRSRELIGMLSDAPLDNDAFPFASARNIGIGLATVFAQRVSFVGELGFELYVPTEFASHVYDTLVDAGHAVDLAHAGLFSLDCCRLEKGFRHWGHDLGTHISPLEAGLGFAVDFDKPGGFIGRDALLQQRANGLDRRLVQFQIDAGKPLLLHDELVYRDGTLVGAITSGNYSPTFDKMLCFALIEQANIGRDFILGGRYEIEVTGRRYPASVLWRAPYGQSGARMRS